MIELEKNIGYVFKNRELLKEALTHSSFVNGDHSRCNERLEFLGDSVLSVTVSQHLFENLKDSPEGDLTKLRAALVCENSLYEFAKLINLGHYLYLGKGEEHTGGRERRSILADAFEAVIAAIYLDGGLDKARSFVLKFIPSVKELKSGKLLFGDYKTILQEIIQRNPEEHICYEIVSENGEAHNKVFVSNVLLNGQKIGSGEGKSKKEAEQAAAKSAIELMGYETY
ncbi:MAG: ribonuclease III [Clostridiales bacterium]|nr:ribonuclease III [Clostridiales bacterium]